jgi:hypothetical protein
MRSKTIDPSSPELGIHAWDTACGAGIAQIQAYDGEDRHEIRSILNYVPLRHLHLFENLTAPFLHTV